MKCRSPSRIGDITYDLTDTISVSVGGRYTNDKRTSRVLRTTFIGSFSDLFIPKSRAVAVATTSDFEGSRFSINWSLGYLDANFNTFIDAFGMDVADQRVFQNTPDYTGHMGFNVGVPAADGMVDFIGLVSFRAEASQFETRNPFLDQEAFSCWTSALSTPPTMVCFPLADM